jgi:hypothetical protein
VTARFGYHKEAARRKARMDQRTRERLPILPALVAAALVVAYDIHERIWNPPMPLLFQRRMRMEDRPIPAATIRDLLDAALARAGLTDASGQPLRCTPHDFRRLFVTDAVMNGMPPHIAQLICGHQDINTTMGYKAVYPEEVINGHRAFIARRRATRPSAEYRIPTDAEWEEFLGHFERRKVALGTCGRAFSTSCVHEHSCLTEMILVAALVHPESRHSLKVTGKNLGALCLSACHVNRAVFCGALCIPVWRLLAGHTGCRHAPGSRRRSTNSPR